ncbi:MAG: aminotransferase class V-fold PLP-dependent enzyme [Pirellulales bacterium]|nr:aminotransferase class V-fold PLP-dependent enzyme [Pirellulales bacterium]
MTSVAETRATLRAAMPAARKFAYFDHAAMSPLPRPAAEAIEAWLREAVEIGNPVWGEWVKKVEAARADAARLIGAHAEEIVLVSNTTSGISIVAEGLDWQPGDNVVTFADEFPSNVYPWMNLASRGVELRRVATEPSGRPDLAKLAAACDNRTRVVTVSWVGFATGYRHDVPRIAEIAHRCGALMFLDGIQALGVFPIDVDEFGIDFLAADSHKWMLGPEGAGIAYIRRNHLDRLRPIGPGWHSIDPGQDYTHIELNLRPTAARYEGGTQNNAGILAMGASIRLLAGLGTANLSAAVLENTDLACERLAKIGARIVSDRSLDHRGGEQRSGIVSFEMSGQDPMALKRHLMRQDIILGCRAGRLRISPHAYNNEEDIDRLVAALSSAAK